MSAKVNLERLLYTFKYIPKTIIIPDQTYCMVKGLVKNINETAMLTALRAVVTVAATEAPEERTNVSTIWIPR